MGAEAYVSLSLNPPVAGVPRPSTSGARELRTSNIGLTGRALQEMGTHWEMSSPFAFSTLIAPVETLNCAERTETPHATF